MRAETSPIFVGNENWTIMKQSVQALLNTTDSACLVLNFNHDHEKFPYFGLTTLPYVEFFCKVVNSNVPPEMCEYVKMHEWSCNDKEYWSTLTIAKCDSIAIFFYYDKSEANRIKVIFEHNRLKSCVYKFYLCPMTNDAYIIFLTPMNKLMGSLSLSTSQEYLEEFINRKMEGYLSREKNYEFEACMNVCGSRVDIVNVPCGHSAFCRKCIKSYNKQTCPICNTDLGLDIEMSRQECRFISSACLVCPSHFFCKKMDCVLIPCGCLIGCFEYAQKAVIPEKGDLCPNDKCGKPVLALQKIFIQREKTP